MNQTYQGSKSAAWQGFWHYGEGATSIDYSTIVQITCIDAVVLYSSFTLGQAFWHVSDVHLDSELEGYEGNSTGMDGAVAMWHHRCLPSREAVTLQ